MRIPDWTPALKHQPQDLVDAILKRRGGALIKLDQPLLWSEPLARGWNVYLKAVRTDLPTSPKLRELGICTVALLSGASYEYQHHAPDFLTAGGTQVELDALNAVAKADARQSAAHPALGEVEQLVIRYAADDARCQSDRRGLQRAAPAFRHHANRRAGERERDCDCDCDLQHGCKVSGGVGGFAGGLEKDTETRQALNMALTKVSRDTEVHELALNRCLLCRQSETSRAWSSSLKTVALY